MVALGNIAVRGMTTVGGRVGNVLIWAFERPRTAMGIYAAAIFAVVAIAACFSPDRAYAGIIEDIGQAIVNGLFGVGGELVEDVQSLALDAAEQGVAGTLRGFVSMVLTAAESIVVTAADGTLLNVTFDNLLGTSGVAERIQEAHEAVAIPLANVVLAIVFVVGLVKLVGKVSVSEGGIDTWQLVWLFVMFAIASAIVQSSWDILGFFYDLGRSTISGVFDNGGVDAEELELVEVSEDITNTGILLFMALGSLIIMFASALVSLGAFISVLGRAVQIYLYTAFAPIPLAFMVTDEGRQIAISFLKKYAAAVLAGALIALVFVLFKESIDAFATIDMDIEDLQGVMNWFISYMMKIAVYGAFAWAFFQTGAWARDLVGA